MIFPVFLLAETFRPERGAPHIVQMLAFQNLCTGILVDGDGDG